MANYECTTRTNYFRVKDEKAFQELMDKVYGSEDSVAVFADKPGYFGFGCYGAIGGLRTNEDEDPEDGAYDDFIDKLQECVADDDAIIIYEAGHEKLRYLVGSVTVITKDAVQYGDIQTVAVNLAQEMLKNEKWTTKSEY